MVPHHPSHASSSQTCQKPRLPVSHPIFVRSVRRPIGKLAGSGLTVLNRTASPGLAQARPPILSPELWSLEHDRTKLHSGRCSSLSGTASGAAMLYSLDLSYPQASGSSGRDARSLRAAQAVTPGHALHIASFLAISRPSDPHMSRKDPDG